MKLKIIVSTLLLGVLMSCSKEVVVDPLDQLFLLEEVAFENATLEVYSTKNRWELGYNKIFFVAKDAAGKEISNPTIQWSPMMHMISKTHSCPVSEVMDTSYDYIKGGFVIFQMPSNDSEYWDLSFTLTVDGVLQEKTQVIDVLQPLDGMKNVAVFQDSNLTNYILAYVGPENPKIAVNDIEMKLYQMQTMTVFSVVQNWRIGLDPRMPSMDNHSSPNNVDLRFNELTKSYEGKLSLTMSGYWKLNLQAFNADELLIKGEEVTDENLASSLYLELEF